MQSNQKFPRKIVLPPSNQDLCNYMHNSPSMPAFGAVLPHNAKHLMPVDGVEFQSSEICPKNFIIVDQTDNRNQIMFHPQIAHKFSYPGFNIHETYAGNFEKKDANNKEMETSVFKEDSGDIDALLSLDEDEDGEEYDEEEVSTARTNGTYGSSSPESCSNYGSKPSRNKLSSPVLMSLSSESSSCKSGRKQLKLKKMVKTLRGIVPGANQMNTVAVLDEAVCYLKSLKVEAQKLGVDNLQK